VDVSKLDQAAAATTADAAAGAADNDDDVDARKYFWKPHC